MSRKYVDVVIATMGQPRLAGCLESLKNLPFPIKIHAVYNKSPFPYAINCGLETTTQDVLLIDDDARILPDTFKDFDKYYPKADVFGFKLKWPSGLIQHAGVWVRGQRVGHLGYGKEDGDTYNIPYYVSGLTAAVLYIKREALNELKGLDNTYPGVQFCDLDFCLRAIKAGYKLLYVPNPAIHDEEIKDRGDEYRQKFALNYEELVKRHLSDTEFTDKLARYPIPL